MSVRWGRAALGAGCALVATLYVLVRGGFGTYPAMALTLDITRALPDVLALPPLGQFLLYSPLGPAIAAALDLTTPAGYQALHVAIFVIGAIVAMVTIRRRWPARVALLAATAFVTSQVPVVVFAWTGSYDVFTILLGTTIVICRTRSAALVAGVFAAFAAFEQSIVTVVVLVVVALLVGDRRRGHYVAAAFGLVAGRIVLTLLLRANDVTSDRRYWLEHFGYGHFLRQFADALPLLVVTGLGASVLIVGACLAYGVPTWRRRLVWIGAIVAPLAPVAFGEDQTRVYANIVWPIVLALVLSAGRSIPRLRVMPLTAATLVVGLLLPPIYLWRGDPHLAEHHLWRLLG